VSEGGKEKTKHRNEGVFMSVKRIIPCLDIKDGRVVKGVQFEGLSDVASPVELAKRYNKDGADELVFYDITASVENRGLPTDLLKQVVKCISIPLTVGGGILTIDDFGRILDLGADKVSINSGVIKNPGLISEAATKYGSQTIVFAADVKRVGGNYHVFASGGREDTGLDAVEWFKRGAGNGAGEIVVNSIDTDGVKGGFDIPMLEAVCDVVSIPVVASGGAGCIDDFIKLFKAIPEIDAGLAASIFHYGEVKIPELKKELKNHGIPTM